jgi:inositol-1,3,4-trisphosphate 5/6-kinase/inositol-tetrakisphosphate 1-kinase
VRFLIFFSSSFGMEGSKNGTLSPSLLHFQHEQHLLIGYYLSRKKLSKLRFEQFLLLCKHFHIDTVELTYGYFERTNVRIPDLIIHKLEEDVLSRSLIDKIRLLPKSSTIILDEFNSISRLSNRYEQYSLLNSGKNFYTVPPFICVTNDDNKLMIEKMLINNQITFPIMCKPIQAHGDKSHDMKIIFDVQHLNDIDKPCVLQQFIDHDGTLFKVFASKFKNV